MSPPNDSTQSYFNLVKEYLMNPGDILSALCSLLLYPLYASIKLLIALPDAAHDSA